MAILTTFEPKGAITDSARIRAFLAERGILFQDWHLEVELAPDATPDQVLDAYRSRLDPYMREYGYATADVVCIDESTPNLPAIRDKFLREHTHLEDEVRCFVAGQGDFWFHRAGEVFTVRCVAGDLISVPAHTPHWFDAGERPYVKAIRVFTDASGWIPHYTGSGIEQRYAP